MTISKMPSLFLGIAIVCQLQACSGLKSKLVGTWIIEAMTVDGNDYLHNLKINSLTFNRNGTCMLAPNSFKERADLDGNWAVQKAGMKKLDININSTNPIFNGRFAIKFFHVEGIEYMQMNSTSVSLTASKLRFDF